MPTSNNMINTGGPTTGDLLGAPGASRGSMRQTNGGMGSGLGGDADVNR